MVACLSVVAVAVYRENQKNTLEAGLAQNCETKSASFFETQRSLGIILRDNSILAVQGPGELDFAPPGGGIDIADDFKSEDTRTALAREINEELGVTVDANEDLREYKTYCEVLDSASARRTHLYFVDSWEGQLNPPEGSQIKWVDYAYRINQRSDSELNQSLEYLQSDSLLK